MPSTIPATTDPERSGYSVVLLAGALRPSPLRRALDIPVLALPLAGGQTMLDRWLRSLADTPGCRAVTIVVSSDRDAQRLRQVIHDARRDVMRALLPEVQVVVDPKEWRGPGGLLRDIAFGQDGEADGVVLVGEAACLPPASFTSILDAFGPGTAAVVGGSASAEPAGVYAFDTHGIEQIPRIGFYDLKEQFIPDLRKAGLAVQFVRTGDEIIRVRNREAYLRAVRRTLEEAGRESECDALATVSGTAYIAGASVIGPSAVIEDGAVVHESILLAGARLRGGAVVSHCVIGPQVEITAGQTVRGEVVAVPAGAEITGANGQVSAHAPRRRFRLSTLLPDAISGGGRP